MKIRHLSVKNFRGIRELDFTVKGNCISLIGAGDSCKTTILDAISYVLSPLWNIQVNDLDFYDGNPENTIEINATIGNIPDGFLDQDKFGMFLRGWKNDQIHDEPSEDAESVITIRCTIDHTFEPKWAVITNQQPEGKFISGADRAKIGVIKIDAFSERNFTWAKHSLLNRLADNPTAGMPATLASIGRNAKQSLPNDSFASLLTLASPLLDQAKTYGVSVTELQPHLDILSLSVTTGGISLHEGNIPLKRFGSGTKRLLSYAISSKVYDGKNILLIDEVEIGLEPNRIIRLIRNLKQQTNQQIFLTSHSPVVLRELTIDDLFVVHKNATQVKAERLSEGLSDAQRDRLQANVRTKAECLLSQRILICEGKTELGIMKALDDKFTSEQSLSFASVGVCLMEGGGNEQFEISKRFSRLGYKTLLFCDSDLREISQLSDDVRTNGAKCIRWVDPVSTDERVFLDLSAAAVQAAIELAIRNHGEQRIVDSVRSQRNTLSVNRLEWVFNQDLRIALGKAAKSGDGWFKRIDYGEELGKIIVGDLPNIPSTDLAIKVEEIKRWAHGDSFAP